METEYCKVFEIDIRDSPVPNYSQEEHGTWALLIETQKKLLPGRACEEYLAGLRAISFPEDRIPRLIDVSTTLTRYTGWKLRRVDGLVHPKDFFSLLSKKIFPSTDFIRERNELLYTPAPDMFHDLFGHTPLLTNPDFCEFFEDIGKTGVRAYEKYSDDHEIHLLLTRIYWFTVEFGLINTSQGVRAWGSGSVSSPKEIEFCVSNACRKHPFDIERVSHKSYDIWKMQEDVFPIESFTKLGQDFRRWAKNFDLI